VIRFLALIPILGILYTQIDYLGDDKVREGVYAFYNYEFDESLKILSRARVDFPDHPGVHFIWAAANWTRSLAFDPVDTAHIVLEKSLAEIQPIYKSLTEKFYLDQYYQLYYGSTIGLSARVPLAKKRWLSTFFRAYQGFKKINKAVSKDPKMLDAKLPIGLVEYYIYMTDSFLKYPIKLYGLNASNNEGINKISIAAESSDWAWIEACGILSFIYLWIDNDAILAGKYARKLVNNFPNNFYFNILLLEANIKNGYYEEARIQISKLKDASIDLTTRQKSWYIPYLEYEIALLHFKEKKYDLAIEYLNKAIDDYDGEFDVVLGYCYLLKGKILDLKDDRKNAKNSYNECASLNNFSGAIRWAMYFLEQPYYISD
tara:strand:- start:452 stop:1573 length:1122 start_codon:yes stop_codon:yes gene_type:complete